MTLWTLVAVAWAEPPAQDQRLVLARTFDHDRNGALDRNELRDLARLAPNGHGDLLGWCASAIGDPASSGVVFRDEGEKSRARCDAESVTAAYLTAWVAAAVKL
jgi:hypothetical protein